MGKAVVARVSRFFSAAGPRGEAREDRRCADLGQHRESRGAAARTHRGETHNGKNVVEVRVALSFPSYVARQRDCVCFVAVGAITALPEGVAPA